MIQISQKTFILKKTYCYYQSALEIKSGKYIFESFKNFLKKIIFIHKDWNALNFLPQNASTVGLLDLNILPKDDEKKNSFLKN